MRLGEKMLPAEARDIQVGLAGKVRIIPFRKKRFLIAGTDVSFCDDDGRCVAGVVIMDFPSLETVEAKWLVSEITFPYISGLLSFREIPPLFDVFEKIENRPDCIMADGQGIAHPKRFGLASHLGLILGIPSIGCAKSRLIGAYKEPGLERGSRAELAIGGETVGSVVRTRTGVAPVFVSPGHMMDIESSVRIVLSCAVTRIPEPTKRAHCLVSKNRLKNF